MLVRLIPFVFVVLWASGFVGARFGLQYAEPATLLSLRMVLNVALFAVLIVFLRRRLPAGKALLHCAVVGVLIHGFYLGGTYLAIDLGMPAGLSSLLVGLQPILTALILVSFVGQSFKASQWLGLALGFVGISLVLMGKVSWQSETHKTAAIILCLISLVGITLGTLYQKKFCQGVDMVGSAAVQYFAASLLFIPYAVGFESMQVDWSFSFVLTMIWLVVVLSCVAILLLLYMVEHGAASSVASVFYLVPPTTAVQAWLMFGESFDGLGVLGFAFAALAVYLVAKAPEFSIFKRRKDKITNPHTL
ncbi:MULTISPECIES: DMT family transporter [Vibrio]|uniref:Multidrug transporter n=1 Tax=Vibrio bivalvicida TaxID=1276888 RepID=A0A177XW16_9VIBR|nr:MULTISPECIES: DMT family transporter [Vibrio]KLN66602.1 multidrug transporter [Vibrio sp. VPAP30]OAJ92780.1 multidrug transporter [Vibrio bivalvicida]